jgi:hypothetical protein
VGWIPEKMRTAAHDIRAVAVLAVVTAALAAVPARAAYAPRLDVSIDPSAAATPTALTATVTQAPGEDASRTIAVQAPAGFALATLPSAACDAGQETAGACPESSRIGSADAVTSAGFYSGGVYFGGLNGGRPKLVVLLSNGGLLPSPITIEGFVEARPDGYMATFDNLPNVPATSLTLRFSGAPRALLTTPTACGDYPFVGRFTSQHGAQVESRSSVAVDGCTQTPPQISSVAVAPRIARVGRRATLRFTLSEDAAVDVSARRIGHRTARPVGQIAGKTGANALPIATRGWRPGAYLLELQATDPSGLQRTKSTRLRVARRR